MRLPTILARFKSVKAYHLYKSFVSNSKNFYLLCTLWKRRTHYSRQQGVWRKWGQKEVHLIFDSLFSFSSGLTNIAQLSLFSVHLFFNWASVPGRRNTIPPPAPSPTVSGNLTRQPTNDRQRKNIRH